MNLVLAKNETGRALSDSFAVARDRLPGTGRVAEARSTAFEAYESVGLPHRRIEDWKYTDLRVLMREVLPLAPAPDAAALKRAAAALKLQAVKGARRLVLVDGVFAPKLSELDGLEKGLTIRTLRDVLERGEAGLQTQLLTPDNTNPIIALNSAMMTDGVVIEIADGVNALRSPDRAMVVITHYQRLLNYIVPDFVHVMSKGRVVKSGGKELALELEASGYAQFEDAA